jgi:O-antigen ligase
MICFVPTALKYVLVTGGKTKAYIFAIIAIILGFISGSRAGALLIIAGSYLTLFGQNLSIRKVLTITFFVTMFYLLLFKTQIASSLLYTVNPDVHSVIYNTKEVFEEDQSMLLRRLMVEKGLILFEKEPFSGLGLNNWPEYEVEFRGDFIGAENIMYKSRLEKFSAHNSYLAFLGEGGAFVFVPFVLMLLLTIIKLIRKFENLDQYQQPILWSLIMMSIHIYFISAMLNSFTWYLLSLGVAAANKSEK